MGDTQQLVQRVRILRRRCFRIGRLTSVSLEGIHLFRELFCSLGESTTPVRTWHFTGAPDPGDGPQRRGQHRRLGDDAAGLVDEQSGAGTSPARTLVVCLTVLAECPVQPLVGRLQVVQPQVERVLPDPFPIAKRRRGWQHLPRQRFGALPLDDPLVGRTLRPVRGFRDLLRTEQLQHPPEPQDILLVTTGPRGSHASILPQP